MLLAGEGILFSTGALFYASSFLLLAFIFQSNWSRIITLWSVGVMFLIGLIGQFRSTSILIVLAAILAWAYVPFRSKRLQAKKLLSCLAVIFAIFVFFNSGTLSSLAGNNDMFNIVIEAFEATKNRLLKAPGESVQQSDDSVQGSIMIRLEESRQALSEGNILQVVFGQGIGSLWSGGTLYDDPRSMLHLGFGHLLFRGGVPLLIMALIFPFGVGLYTLVRSRDPLILICASFILTRAVALFVSNQFSLSLGYVLMLLCAGGCLRYLIHARPANC